MQEWEAFIAEGTFFNHLPKVRSLRSLKMFGGDALHLATLAEYQLYTGHQTYTVTRIQRETRHNFCPKGTVIWSSLLSSTHKMRRASIPSLNSGIVRQALGGSWDSESWQALLGISWKYPELHQGGSSLHLFVKRFILMLHKNRLDALTLFSFHSASFIQAIEMNFTGASKSDTLLAQCTHPSDG